MGRRWWSPAPGRAPAGPSALRLGNCPRNLPSEAACPPTPSTDLTVKKTLSTFSSCLLISVLLNPSLTLHLLFSHHAEAIKGNITGTLIRVGSVPLHCTAEPLIEFFAALQTLIKCTRLCRRPPNKPRGAPFSSAGFTAAPGRVFLLGVTVLYGPLVSSN